MVDHSNKKPRILLLSTAYFPLVGGSELAIRNLTERMQGFEFDMVTGRYSAGVPAVEQVGRVRVFRVGGKLGRISFLVPKAFLPIAIFMAAWRLARKNNYVLIHAYQASQAAGAAWLLSWVLPQVPRVVTVQEGKDLESQDILTRWLRRLILRRASAVTVISEYLEEFVRGETNSPVYTIPNGVSLSRFMNRPDVMTMRRVHEHMGVGPHHRIIISVSRLVEKNGLPNLIRAFARVRSTIVQDEPVLVLIGTGEQEDELKHLTILEEVSNSVRFLGHVEHSKLPGYLHAAHVFARPSLSEGMGSAFLEAMATRTPVVASTVGGIRDFLRDEETGFACNPEDPDDIARVLIRALTDREARERVSQRAFEMVTQRYDWDRISREMESVYHNILS